MVNHHLLFDITRPGTVELGEVRIRATSPLDSFGVGIPGMTIFDLEQGSGRIHGPWLTGGFKDFFFKFSTIIIHIIWLNRDILFSYIMGYDNDTWWFIPRIVSGLVHPNYKWINPTKIPFITGVISHLLTGMSHQV